MAAGEQYPDDWDTRRREVYERDDYECQNWDCNAAGGPKGDAELHAHHVTPISEGGSHDKENLVTLCQSCHNDQHDHDITAGEQAESDSLAESPGIGTRWVIGPLMWAVMYGIGVVVLSVIGVVIGDAFNGWLEIVLLTAVMIGWLAMAAAAAMANPCRRFTVAYLIPLDVYLFSQEVVTIGPNPAENGGLVLLMMFHLPFTLWVFGRIADYIGIHFEAFPIVNHS